MKSQSIYNMMVLSFLIAIGILAILAGVYFGKIKITGFAIDSGENVIESSSEIEVWANTLIDISKKDNEKIEATLIIDNGEAISNNELELDFNAQKTKLTTDSEGRSQLALNLSDIGLGSYSLITEFQGLSESYLNPSSAKTEIEIFDENGTKDFRIINTEIENPGIEIPEENSTALNQTNITIPVMNESNLTIIQNETNFTINLVNFECNNFLDNILWSSKYSNNHSGSVSYDIWFPKNNCSDQNKDNCFMTDIKLHSRLISSDYSNEGERIGYIQISNLENNNCKNPQDAEYSTYLTYDNLFGEEKKEGEYCKEGKEKECRDKNKIATYFLNYSECYGIKSYGSKSMIVDAFSVNYTICGGKNGIA